MEKEIDKKIIEPSFEKLVSLVENLRNPQREEIRDAVAKIIETALLYSNVRKEAVEFTNKKRIKAIKQKCMDDNDDKKFQDEWKLEREMIKNRQVCETCKHWQVGNYENCLKKFICHLPDNTCLNWEEGIKAEYYPYPPNATWEEIEEINKKHIEEWKEYLEKQNKTLDKNRTNV